MEKYKNLTYFYTYHCGTKDVQKHIINNKYEYKLLKEWDKNWYEWKDEKTQTNYFHCEECYLFIKNWVSVWNRHNYWISEDKENKDNNSIKYKALIGFNSNKDLNGNQINHKLRRMLESNYSKIYSSIASIVYYEINNENVLIETPFINFIERECLYSFYGWKK